MLRVLCCAPVAALALAGSAQAGNVPVDNWVTVVCANGTEAAITPDDITMPPSLQLSLLGCVPANPDAVPADPATPPAPTDPAIVPPGDPNGVDPNQGAADPSIYITVRCQDGEVWNFVKNDPTNPVSVQEAEAGCVPVTG